jgi:hypothetical protein
MGFESDLLLRKALAWNYTLVAHLEARGLPPAAAEWTSSLLPLLELIALVSVLAVAMARLDDLWGDRSARGRGRWLPGAFLGASGLAALYLLRWVYRHPAADLNGLVCRWDYLVFAILAGIVVRRIPLRARVWLFALLSAVLILEYVRGLPFAVVMLGCVLGFAATRWPATDTPARRVVIQTVLMAAVFVWLWRHRSVSGFEALMGWGFYSFALFRHLSFVVESGRGVPATLGGYLCFLLFYPNCFGAMEVYNEFWEHNLAGERACEYRDAALRVAKGAALTWIGVSIPMSEEQVRESVGFAAMWTNVLVLFIRAACASMGIWNMIEGGALFLGFRLRPNFRGVLLATNPSQFWRAWRGTMTNWLIRYIYIPLGGNRRHRTMNILAALVVSTLWHVAGIPFLRAQTWRPYEMVPIVAWGAVNFAGIATHAWARRRWPPDDRPPLRVLKWSLTMCFGTFTVSLLGFALGGAERFGHMARTLLGLEGW